MPKDVLIAAPPIRPDGSVLLTDAEVRSFNSDYETLKEIASNLATMLIAVISKEVGENQYLIPKDHLQRVKGAKIVLEEAGDGDVIAKISDRPPALVVVEGRK